MLYIYVNKTLFSGWKFVKCEGKYPIQLEKKILSKFKGFFTERSKKRKWGHRKCLIKLILVLIYSWFEDTRPTQNIVSSCFYGRKLRSSQSEDVCNRATGILDSKCGFKHMKMNPFASIRVCEFSESLCGEAVQKNNSTFTFFCCHFF